MQLDQLRKLIIGMGDFTGHVGRNIDGFQVVSKKNCIGEGNQEKMMLLEFRDAKHICIPNTWPRKADKKKITYGTGCNESEINFLWEK